MQSDNPDYLKEIKGWQLNSEERFRKWIEKTDKNDIHDLAAKIFHEHVIDPTKFCLSSEWASWNYMRLIYAKAFEYSYLQMTGSCPADENAERDLMDIEYLAFLAKCDGLLTKDAKLRYLAEVTYTNKKVYSCIPEVDNEIPAPTQARFLNFNIT